MSVKWHRLGEFIEECDERNVLGEEFAVLGLNKDKKFIPTVANMDGVDTSRYKIVTQGCFVFSGMQTGRDVCIRLGLYEAEEKALVSPAYTTFRLTRDSSILSEYLFLFFNREESDRYGWFLSDSSVRANLDWTRFLDIQIPVPPIEEQRKVVAAWQGLRRMKEQNEQLAEPLLALCRSYLQECKKKYPMTEIGPMIKEVNERNEAVQFGAESVRGLSTAKTIIPTAANLLGVNLASYKKVSPRQFAYVSDTSRRGDKVSLGYNETGATFLVSSISAVFGTNENILDSAFLYLWFCRPEFDRYARFNSWGSARETFDWNDMCRVKIPLPPIEVQQAVVDLYRCANEAKKIAAEADRLSREICPALIQNIVKETL